MFPLSSSSSPSSHQNQPTSSSSSRRQLRRQLHHPLPPPPPPPPSRLSSITNIPEAQAPQPLPLLPKQALLPPPALSSNKNKTKKQQQHPLLRCDLAILQLIQDHIASLEDHVAWSRVCRRMRSFYAGEEAGVKAFWSKALLVKEGWGLPPSPSPTPATPFLTLLLHLTHRRTCSLEVLRPWKYGPPPKEERLVDLRGEWVKLCRSNGEEEGIWPPTTTTPPHSQHNHNHLQPNPFLSDLTLPLSPPPPASSSLFEHITVIASDDSSIHLSDHSSFLNQLATWPAREVVEVEFVWEAKTEASAVGGEGKDGKGRAVGKKGHSHRKKAVGADGGGAAGGGASGIGGDKKEPWTGLSNGRVVVVVGRKGSGRLVTVQALLEGMVDYWRAELVWEETRSLVKNLPGLDRRTGEQRLERGGWNKFLGQVRKDYGRWAWLGDQVVFAGFTPSLTHPSSRLTAHIVSNEKIESFYPPSSPEPELGRVEKGERKRIGGGEGEGGEVMAGFDGGEEGEREW